MDINFFNKYEDKLFKIGDSVKVIHKERSGWGDVTFLKLGKVEAIDEVFNVFVKIRDIFNDGETIVRFSQQEIIDMLKKNEIQKI